MRRGAGHLDPRHVAVRRRPVALIREPVSASRGGVAMAREPVCGRSRPRRREHAAGRGLPGACRDTPAARCVVSGARRGWLAAPRWSFRSALRDVGSVSRDVGSGSTPFRPHPHIVTTPRARIPGIGSWIRTGNTPFARTRRYRSRGATRCRASSRGFAVHCRSV